VASWDRDEETRSERMQTLAILQCNSLFAYLLSRRCYSLCMYVSFRRLQTTLQRKRQQPISERTGQVPAKGSRSNALFSSDRQRSTDTGRQNYIQWYDHVSLSCYDEVIKKTPMLIMTSNANLSWYSATANDVEHNGLFA